MLYNSTVTFCESLQIMNGLFGWTGKILKVDLERRKTSLLDTTDYYDLFLGGLGIGAKLYWEFSQDNLDAFRPDMPLIFMTGPLAGTPVPSASRLVICGKSPCIYPETFVSASIGGFFASELKRAGYDGIVISGKADRPVYLAVTNECVEIKEASHLWGLTNSKTHQALKAETNDRARLLSIGPGGESQVRFGAIHGDIGSNAAMGFGAVMGSKNLKAIVVSGTSLVPVANRGRVEELRNHFRRMTGDGYFNVFGTPAGFPGSGVELVRKAHCYNCPQGCYRALFRNSKGTENIAKCVASIYYRSWDARRNGHLTEASFEATNLANDYSICASDLMMVLEWLKQCRSEGLLSEQLQELDFKDIGSVEFLQNLVNKICQKEGFGEVLSQGAYRASMICGPQTKGIASEFLTPSGRLAEAYSPRVFIIPAIFYAIEKRPPIAELHDVCKPLVKWAMWYVSKGRDSCVSTEVLRNIGEMFWGNQQSMDFSTYEGKALAALKIQNREYAKESLALCDFAFPVFDDASSPGHVGNPSLESRFLSAVTGRDIDEAELETYGERIFNLNRAILLREGTNGKEDDSLPEFYFTQGEQTIPDAFGRRNHDLLLPGAGDNIISRKGATVDREKFTAMRSEYYNLRGWDTETGLLRQDKLIKLGLEGIVPILKNKVV